MDLTKVKLGDMPTPTAPFPSAPFPFFSYHKMLPFVASRKLSTRISFAKRYIKRAIIPRLNSMMDLAKMSPSTENTILIDRIKSSLMVANSAIPKLTLMKTDLSEFLDLFYEQETNWRNMRSTLNKNQILDVSKHAVINQLMFEIWNGLPITPSEDVQLVRNRIEPQILTMRENAMSYLEVIRNWSIYIRQSNAELDRIDVWMQTELNNTFGADQDSFRSNRTSDTPTDQNEYLMYLLIIMVVLMISMSMNKPSGVFNHRTAHAISEPRRD